VLGVVLDLDDEAGVRQADPVAGRGPVHGGQLGLGSWGGLVAGRDVVGAVRLRPQVAAGAGPLDRALLRAWGVQGAVDKPREPDHDAVAVDRGELDGRGGARLEADCRACRDREMPAVRLAAVEPQPG